MCCPSALWCPVSRGKFDGGYGVVVYHNGKAQCGDFPYRAKIATAGKNYARGCGSVKLSCWHDGPAGGRASRRRSGLGMIEPVAVAHPAGGTLTGHSPAAISITLWYCEIFFRIRGYTTSPPRAVVQPTH
jgi:hypothetical protein